MNLEESEFFESEKCVLEGCDFVGKTSYALETHIRSFHEEQLDYRKDFIILKSVIIVNYIWPISCGLFYIAYMVRIEALIRNHEKSCKYCEKKFRQVFCCRRHELTCKYKVSTYEVPLRYCSFSIATDLMSPGT